MAEHALTWRKSRLGKGDRIVTWWDEGDHVWVLWYDAKRAARGEAPYWLDHMARFIGHSGHQINGGGPLKSVEGFSHPTMTPEAQKRLQAYLAE